MKSHKNLRATLVDNGMVRGKRGNRSGLPLTPDSGKGEIGAVCPGQRLGEGELN